MSKVSKLQETLETARRKIQEEGEEALLEIARKTFEAVPVLYEIVLRQYTPSFNDGDPCTNFLSDPRVRIDWEQFQSLFGSLPEHIQEAIDAQGYDEPEWCELGEDEDGLEYAYEGLTGVQEFDSAIEEASRAFYNAEDIIELLYETNMTITFSRDGSVETEYYYCGY